VSEQDNRRLVEEGISAFNAHDPERYVKNAADFYVWESDAFPTPMRGREAVKQAIAMSKDRVVTSALSHHANR
jgi:hypothetical protein